MPTHALLSAYESGHPRDTHEDRSAQQNLRQTVRNSGKTNKSALKNVLMHQLSWGALYVEALLSIQNSFRKSVKIAFPKDGKVICVFGDASGELWASTVTRTSKRQLKPKMQGQKCEPMAFPGETFVDKQGNRMTYQKEGHAILQTFEQMECFLQGSQPVHLFTDHRSRLYVLAP